MTAIRRLTLIAALVLTVVAPRTASGQDGGATGGTQVSVDGPDVTITVTIDLILGGIGEQELPEGSHESATALAEAIEAYWNQGLERYATDCLDLRLDVVINPLPSGDPPTWRVVDLGDDRPVTIVTEPGHHVAFWMDGGAHGSPSPPATFDPYDDDGIAQPGQDYGSPYEQDLYAYWSPHMETQRDFAHEFGHLLGLGDDYTSAGPIPGREGTLMADGDFVDENLMSRLTELARDADPAVPECDVWRATLQLQARQELPSGDVCEVSGTATGDLSLGEDGRILGTLQAEETETCTFGFDRTRSGLELTLDGVLSASAITVSHTAPTTTGYFPFVFISWPSGNLEPVAVPITAPGVAQGTVTKDLPNDYTVTVDFDLRCGTCAAD